LHEQIALAVAEANGCNYCLAAHTLLGKGAGLTSSDILAARAGEASDPRSAAALALARKLVERRGAVGADDIAAARAGSLSDADIVEIVASVAINVLTNYVNIAADTDIDFPPVDKLQRAA
jgi:AhpD family alkylhydroperoxidase